MTDPRKHEFTHVEDSTGSNNRDGHAGFEAPADAISTGAYYPPDRAPQRAPLRATASSADRIAPASHHSPLQFLDDIAPLPGLRMRESSLVYLTVMLRLVGYDQLRRLLFPHQNAAAVRKAARSLEEEGWLQRWNAPMPGVGRLGHVHPTTKALNAVLDTIPPIVAREPWSKVVHLMLPRSGRRALDLSARPKWFAHQREVNQIATSLMCGGRVLWISTWDSPFPMARSGESELPQPDYILVEHGQYGPTLVFGEHDRGNEPLDRFIDRKLRAYVRLAAVAEQTLGLPAFRVDVSVCDVRTRMPIARVRQLISATRDYGAVDLFRFTLAGWLHAYPTEEIWFSGIPESESVCRWDHPVLGP